MSKLGRKEGRKVEWDRRELGSELCGLGRRRMLSERRKIRRRKGMCMECGRERDGEKKAIRKGENVRCRKGWIIKGIWNGRKEGEKGRMIEGIKERI